MIPINCILAVDENMGIASINEKGSFIPWHIREDLSFFKDITTHVNTWSKINAVIMGRKTWETIKCPLKNRLNVVISSTITDKTNTDNLLWFTSTNSAITYLNTLSNIESIFICGGVNLYNEFINSDNLQYLYLTKINHNYNTSLIVNMDLTKYKIMNEKTIDTIDMNDNSNVTVTFYQYKKNNIDEEQLYLDILKDILENGHHRQTRNGMTRTLFGKYLSFDLADNKFPLLTTKKMFTKGIFEELIFFCRGLTDSKLLENNKIMIWESNTNRQFLNSLGKTDWIEGDMGPMYGYQWLHFNAPYDGCKSDYTNKGFNQLQYVIDLLKTDKFSRRILMTTYNPIQANEGVLYPCHGISVQFGIEDDNKLCCIMHQRSADSFLGLPFNISSYSLLVYLICELINNDTKYTGTKIVPGKLHMTLGDVHIYDEHIDAVKTQLSRYMSCYEFPTIKIDKKICKLEDFNTLSSSDIKILNYKHHDPIKAKMIA